MRPKYDALIVDVRMSDYGYWVVKFSVAPGVYLSMMVCQTGVTRDQAVTLAATGLVAQTGSKVRR